MPRYKKGSRKNTLERVKELNRRLKEKRSKKESASDSASASTGVSIFTSGTENANNLFFEGLQPLDVDVPLASQVHFSDEDGSFFEGLQPIADEMPTSDIFSEGNSNDGLIHSHRELSEEFYKNEDANKNEEEKKIKIGTRIVDLDYFIEQLQEISIHPRSNCTLAEMGIENVSLDGLKTVIAFKCKMCNDTFKVNTQRNSSLDLNLSSILGVLASGNGFSQIEELFASMNMKWFTMSSYQKHHEKISKILEEVAMEEMLEAGKEEAKLAIEEGSVNDQGIPMITVITDGSWAKRSYKFRYDSSSGTAVIIGARTGKVLFVAVKNKFCSFCARYRDKKIPDHKCFKNYNGSSTAMESEGILEGFKQSLSMHNLIYKKMIGDGDSSVHRKIIDALPYGANCLVEKIECRNHVLRNYGNRMRDLCMNRKVGNGEGRNLLKKNLMRLRTAVTCAIKYWSKQDVEDHVKVTSLRKDVINGPFHVFGEHSKCLSYFCKRKETGEVNFVPELQKTGLFQEIQSAANLVSNKVSSLILNKDNNRVETFNSVIAKMNGGKRIDTGKKNSYKARVHAALISMNTKGDLFRRISKSVTAKSPGSITKRHISKRKRQRNSDNEAYIKRKESGGSCKRRIEVSFPDEDYGPDADTANTPDITPEEYEERKNKYLESIKKSPDEIKDLEEKTRGQSSNAQWLEIRRKLLTSSNFGKICKMRATTSCAKTVENIMYPTFSGSKATEYGHEKEPLAKEETARHFNIEIQDCGLVIDQELPFLGASPDGLVSHDTVVEIKCPYKARNMTPIQAVENKMVTFCTIDENGSMHLKKEDNYMYQIQGQLHILQRKRCIFVFYTPLGVLFEEIEKDDDFWKTKIEAKLKAFFYNCILPEIIDSRKARGQRIRDPDYITEAVKTQAMAKKEKIAKKTKETKNLKKTETTKKPKKTKERNEAEKIKESESMGTNQNQKRKLKEPKKQNKKSKTSKKSK